MNAIPLTILLVEDNPIMGESLLERFEIEGFVAEWVSSCAAARQRLTHRPFDLVLSDLRLPDGDGAELFRSCKAQGLTNRWFFITAFGTIDQAVALLKEGAVDYVTKPFHLDALIEKLRSFGQQALPAYPHEPTLGLSPVMQRLEAQLPRIASRARAVLIYGESGVGKEVVARALHRASAAAPAPFVAVNCAAIPEGLCEAEFFGYVKGAFTGANHSHKGFFEQANGGTLFLDEIGDMPLAMQAKLLRVLETCEIFPLGRDRPLSVDLRILSATHRDLRTLISQGLFREDLFYRLNIIQLTIPPLRERREDILWLANRFLREIAPEKHFSHDALQALLTYDWPGNVRELKNVVERGAILAVHETITAADLFGHGLLPAERTYQTLSAFLQQQERAYILEMLHQCAGHIGKTAQRLGISRKNLWERMKRLQLSHPTRSFDYREE